MTRNWPLVLLLCGKLIGLEGNQLHLKMQMIIYFMGNRTGYLFTHFEHDQEQQFGKPLLREKGRSVLANGAVSQE